MSQNQQKSRRQALTVLMDVKWQGCKMVATTSVMDHLDNTTLLVLSNFFLRSLGKRVGLERAKELLERSLYNG